MLIIAVDDEAGALALLCDAIKANLPEADLHPFRSPDEALGFAREHKADIAFLDIRMFGTTGIELAAKMKETNPALNVIFVTGYDEFTLDAIYLHASGYVTKPVTAAKVREQLDNLLHPLEAPTDRFFARTFGNFEFLADGKPVSFPREKSRELLALLIDRNGTSLTTEQIAAVLYEDRFYDRKMKNLLMPIIRCLTETLESVGAGEVLIKTWGHLAVDKTKFRCDAYDYADGVPEAINSFRGDYMANYSWAEERAALFYWDRVDATEKNK